MCALLVVVSRKVLSTRNVIKLYASRFSTKLLRTPMLPNDWLIDWIHFAWNFSVFWKTIVDAVVASVFNEGGLSWEYVG